MIDPMEGLSRPVLRWYAQHARVLPWREATATPWGVLVSEVMLQQTPVPRVLPAWSAWLKRWPTPAALAADAPGEAVRQWGRLGYPRRALRLHDCAVILTERHGGTVPRDLDALLALPGLGAYTARAVAAFAFGQRHPVVDTNVRRLVSRAVRGHDAAGRSTTAADLTLVADLLPMAPARAARLSVALMELGALVCTARAPACDRCPLSSVCRWRSVGRPSPDLVRRRQGYAGTDRQVRGLLLEVVRDATGPVPRARLNRVWPDPVRRDRALAGLIADGLIEPLDGDLYRLPGVASG